jgi:hypothetical protein
MAGVVLPHVLEQIKFDILESTDLYLRVKIAF